MDADQLLAMSAAEREALPIEQVRDILRRYRVPTDGPQGGTAEQRDRASLVLWLASKHFLDAWHRAYEVCGMDGAW